MTDLDLEAIEARVERARSAESWDDWNLERDALTDSVGDVPALVAEVRRLRGDLTEQEYAEAAEAELKQSVAARDRLLSTATADRDRLHADLEQASQSLAVSYERLDRLTDPARDRQVAAAALRWAADTFRETADRREETDLRMADAGRYFASCLEIDAHRIAEGQLEVPS